MHSAQLEYFLAIVRTKRFSRAAEEVFVSQSSLSKQIKSLEEELGVELFNRGYSEITLTPAGEMFNEFAREAYTNWEGIVRRIARFQKSAHKTIRVGALPLMGAYDLHSDLADYQLDHMDTHIEFYERSQEEIIRRLEMSRLDVAFLRTDFLPSDTYEWTPLVRDELVLVCAAQHALARKKSVNIASLQDECFVLMDEKSAIHRTFMDECRRSGFIPNITFTHARHEPLVSAVSRDIGITALPRGLAAGRFESLISCIPFTEPIFSDIGLVAARNGVRSEWADDLIDRFRERYPNPLPASQVVTHT